MNLLSLIQEIFHPLKNAINLTEKYSSFSLKLQLPELLPLNSNEINRIGMNISERDSWNLKIVVGGGEPITLNSVSNNVDQFTTQINDLIQYLDDEAIELILDITKETSQGKVSVYCFATFVQFLDNISPIGFLNIIDNDLKKNNSLYFDLKEEEVEKFKTKYIGFGLTPDLYDDNQDSSIKYKESCHFSNFAQYPYSPDYFNLLHRPKSENVISLILDKLNCIFLIASIYDITSITNDNIFYFKVNGYKTIEGRFDINDCIITSNKTYFKIYKWIYSNSGNTADKIGLTRNILSIYLTENSIEIPEAVYASIQSGFKVYLQDNLNKYIEIRNKISDQLLLISQKANQVVDSYLSNYQKSNTTFITFFISVFLLRVLGTGNFQNVFTKDATVISFVLLYFSIIYLIFSLRVLNKEIERLEFRYNNLKVRFEDLLDKQDIEKIVSQDREFNSEIEFIKDRRNEYTFLWVITIIIFFCLILSLSSYFNWNTLYEIISAFT
jgi:hypothetical protein